MIFLQTWYSQWLTILPLFSSEPYSFSALPQGEWLEYESLTKGDTSTDLRCDLAQSIVKPTCRSCVLETLSCILFTATDTIRTLQPLSQRT